MGISGVRMTFGIVMVMGSMLAFAEVNDRRETAPESSADFAWAPAQLERWRSNTREFMNQLPLKERSNQQGPLPRRQEDRVALFEQKGRFRDHIRQHSQPTKKISPIGDLDRPENLINPQLGADGKWLPIYDRLEDMETARLTSRATAQPWSDSYWPVYQGGLASRYGARGFPSESRDWEVYKEFSTRSESTANLSPIEKYELLFGHVSGSLNRKMWDIGQFYQDKYGEVETWIGICHGWSYASFNLPRPRKAFRVKTELGTANASEIVFYPSDVKALGSYLWSQSELTYRFVGTRCGEKHPPQDPNGRIDSNYPECVDSNPGTWHISLVNEVGLRNRSLVFDSSYDYEVWNFPIFSYSYAYFNPSTGRMVDTLAKATVSAKFAGDKYAKYRHANAKSIVGIAMKVSYSASQEASHRRTDSGEDDTINSVHYVYDLEIDSGGHIIGGEWYQNAHPDFLWTMSPDTEVVSSGDGIAKSPWDGVTAPPADWRDAVAESALSSHLLPKAVRKLFDLSQ